MPAETHVEKGPLDRQQILELVRELLADILEIEPSTITESSSFAERGSQVVLALQLPFAMFPLLHFASSRKRMGQWRLGWFLLIAGWGSAILITAFDFYGLPDAIKQAWQVIKGG